MQLVVFIIRRVFYIVYLSYDMLCHQARLHLFYVFLATDWQFVRFGLPFVYTRAFIRLLLNHLTLHRRHNATKHFFRTQASNVLWQRTTPIGVGWFADRTWKNNNKQYKNPPKLLCEFHSIYIIYKCSSEQGVADL